MLTTAASWYLTLRKQARAMKRAGGDPRSAAELLASVPPGDTVMEIGEPDLIDPRFSASRVVAIQRREELLELLARLEHLQPSRLCEIGTAAGGTLYLLTRVAQESAVIVSIDISAPAHTRRARQQLVRASQTVVSVQGDSHDPASRRMIEDCLGGEPLDFLLIDGDHSYEGVKTDFELYSPLVREGGLIALHDINPDSDGPGGPISGDVPRYWRELAAEWRTEELIHAPSGEGLGIGLVLV
jgi:predicted O-methyltransferase YrrM